VRLQNVFRFRARACAAEKFVVGRGTAAMKADKFGSATGGTAGFGKCCSDT